MSLRWLILIVIDVLLALTALYSAAVVRLGYSEVSNNLSEISTLQSYL
jgi:hypothetical protein